MLGDRFLLYQAMQEYCSIFFIVCFASASQELPTYSEASVSPSVCLLSAGGMKRERERAERDTHPHTEIRISTGKVFGYISQYILFCGRLPSMNDGLRKLYDEARFYGKGLEEWWWCRDPALHQIATALHNQNHVIIDNFLLLDEARALRAEVGLAYDAGMLKAPGVIGGGRLGHSASFTDKSRRGDVLGYFDGTEDEWIRCGSTLKRTLDKMVSRFI